MKKAIITTLVGIVFAGAAVAAARTVVTTDIKPMSTSGSSTKFKGTITYVSIYDFQQSLAPQGADRVPDSSFPIVPVNATKPFTVSVTENKWTYPIFYGEKKDKRRINGCIMQFSIQDKKLWIATEAVGNVTSCTSDPSANITVTS